VGDQSTESQGKLVNALALTFIPVGTITTIVGIVLIAKAGPQKPEGDKEKKDKDKDAVWRSLQVGFGAPGAQGGLSLTGKF
jgi:hypothetical protein